MRRRSPIVFSTLLLSAALLMAACGPPPKPAELQKLEDMRNDRYTATISQVEPTMLDAADKLYKEAIREWQNSKVDRARELAWLGQRRYRTAEAITRTKEAQDRFDKADQEIKKLQQEMQVLAVRKDALQKSITGQQQLLSTLQSSTADRARSNVEQQLLLAQKERERAAAVNAAEFAPEQFAVGELAIQRAQEQLNAGQLELATQSSVEAITAFTAAIVTSRPAFDKLQSSAQRAEREKALFDAAQRSFAGNTFKDQRGVIVVLPGFFERNKTAPLGGRLGEVDNVAQIGKDFPELTLIIEGYTQSRGTASQNLSVSQSRADNIRDLLVQKGIDAKRLLTTAHGSERARYDNKSRTERDKNDRVEIVFVLTN